eukprot:5885574-Lingulodinium_polyedra.AAC.1
MRRRKATRHLRAQPPVLVPVTIASESLRGAAAGRQQEVHRPTARVLFRHGAQPPRGAQPPLHG